VVGLRERKKAQTRQRIADTAHRLFGERGFQRVTVAEVAREADVAEATLFNYFPTKEDLFYSGLEEFGARLVEAVRRRPAGEPALVAFRTFLLGEAEQLDRIGNDQVALEHASANARVVLASPALQTRERQVLAGIATALAAALDGRTSGPVRHAVANALLGVHTALLDYARERLAGPERPKTIGADVRARTVEALALLEHGLGDFASDTADRRG
jgi:AcrR family transcriptional regulator